MFPDLQIMNAIVHWDVKLIEDTVLCQKFDRVAVLVTVGKSEHLLVTSTSRW